MVLASLVFLHAIAGQSFDQVAIPVLHTRPSKILAKLGDLEDPGVNLVADDVKSVIIVTGDRDSINLAQPYINLFDVAARKVSVAVNIGSILDKQSFECSATVCNCSQWKTVDSDIDVEISVSPRINDDNTVTLFVQFKSSTMKVSLDGVRVNNKKTATFSVRKHDVQFVEDFNHLPRNVSPLDPLIRFTPTIADSR